MGICCGRLHNRCGGNRVAGAKNWACAAAGRAQRGYSRSGSSIAGPDCYGDRRRARGGRSCCTRSSRVDEQGRTELMSGPIRLLVGSDSAGFDYKDRILADMQADNRVEVVDLGVFQGDLDGSSYPSVAIAAGKKIAAGEADRESLVWGTGIGGAIAAKKVPGIRAPVAHDSFSVERSILSNDCQVLTLGQRVIGLQLARRLAREWLEHRFDPDHPPR